MKSSCEQILQKLLDSADDGLTRQEREHLQLCRTCREAYENVSAVGPELVRVAKQAKAHVPSRLRPELKEQVLVRVRAAFTSTIRHAAPQPRRRHLRSLWTVLASALAGDRARFLAWATAAAAVVILIGITLSSFARQRPIGKLEFTRGVVQVREASRNLQREGIVALKIHRSAVIKVPQQSMGLFSLNDRVRCALAGSTELAVADRDRVDLLRGTAWFRVLPEGKGFEVHSPHGVVRVVGTSFGVTVNDDETRVEVTEGTVWVSHAARRSTVTAGQLARATQDAVRGPSARAEGTELPKWVTSLLAEEEAAHVGQYLPSLAIE